MKFELYTDVALASDLPDHRLRRGDIVKLVEHHIAPDGTEGYSIEVFNALGNTSPSLLFPHRPSNLFGKTKFSVHGRLT